MADISSMQAAELKVRGVRWWLCCAVFAAAFALAVAVAPPQMAYADNGAATGNLVEEGGIVAHDGGDALDYDIQSGYWVRSTNGKWWFKYEDGTYAVGVLWIETGDSYEPYYFDRSGWMVTGWYREAGKWFYSKSSGVLARGWQKVQGKWYYLNPADGAMQTGWQEIGGKWYRLNSSGAMQTGWQKIGGEWYYLNGSGDMATGWKKLAGKWYYLKDSGAMATGWQQIESKWYHLDASGVMSSSRWVENYYVYGSGVMATNTWIGKYYVGSDGKWIPGYNANNAGNGSTVYWVDNGKVYHTSQNCTTLKQSDNIKSGTIAESGKDRACSVCAR